MSKLDKALMIDLAERAEELSKEADDLRDKPVHGPRANRDELDSAVVSSVQKLRRLAQR
jgi:uncharacterized coiled-coil DUF342 family protein